MRCPWFPPFPWNMMTVGRVAANYSADTMKLAHTRAVQASLADLGVRLLLRVLHVLRVAGCQLLALQQEV